jgi:hypothetical protein
MNDIYFFLFLKKKGQKDSNPKQKERHKAEFWYISWCAIATCGEENIGTESDSDSQSVRKERTAGRFFRKKNNKKVLKYPNQNYVSE